MFGILLTFLGEGASQISSSIGKYEAMHKHESALAIGFLSFLWTIPLLLLWTTVGPGELRFSPESLPTFGLRIILEFGVLYFALHALIEADRSTFSFLRTLTIPLLLVVDLALGYEISLYQLFSILLVISGSILLASRKALSRRGKMHTLFSAVLAVGTISLFKYNITHFNSVEAEQLFSLCIFVTVMWIVAYVRYKENLFAYLTKPVFFKQSLFAGFAHIFLAFAYLYATPSVITAARRAFEIVGSMVMGKRYFHEHHMATKLGASMLVITGISLTVVSL